MTTDKNVYTPKIYNSQTNFKVHAKSSVAIDGQMCLEICSYDSHVALFTVYCNPNVLIVPYLNLKKIIANIKY